MKLYTLGLRHYGPKSSESGIHQLIIAENEEQVLQWCFDSDILSEDDLDEEMEHSECLDKEEDAAEVAARAKEIGLSFEHDFSNYYDMKGTRRQLHLLNRGSFEECNDVYYGHTDYFWDEGKDVSADQVQVLEDLGLVKNLAI